MESLLLPLPLTKQARPAKMLVVFDNNFPRWKSLKDYDILDNVDLLADVASRVGATLDTSHTSHGYMFARANAPSATINSIRSSLVAASTTIDHETLPLNSQFVYVGGAATALVPQFAEQLESLGTLCNVALVVTRSGFDHDLHIYGDSDAVAYARYRAKILLELTYGNYVEFLDVPYSMHPLLCGPKKAHLMHIFNQTGVNVYAPPQLLELRGPHGHGVLNRSLNEICLVGDSVQVQVAKKLVANIFAKTDTLFKDVQITRAAAEALTMPLKSDIEAIMNELATFIQLPHLTAEVAVVRVMGTNRSSIERSIERLMKLCSMVYTARLECSDGKALARNLVTDEALIAVAQHGATIVAFHNSSFVVSGLDQQVQEAISSLGTIAGIAKAKHQVVFDLEVSVELKDFIAGKKMGKISKIAAQVNSYIWFSPLHDYNFHVHITAKTVAEAVRALALLEDELPAEQWLYIPEPYHKQVIGTGGSRIQSLMRKYNVYIKFGNSGDKIPNAFGPSQIDNVLIRCPAKNQSMLGAAAEELLETVDQYAAGHQSVLIRLPRNHRRLLIAEAANAMRDIEVANNILINLPIDESRNTELIPVTGMGPAVETAVDALKQLIPIDYEFRVAMSRTFAQAVGVGSDFAARVVAPLCIAFNAQVQAFERVQMQGDNGVYSQIVVSVAKHNEDALDQIAEIITAYLRDNNMDIIDKGRLKSDPVVEAQPAKKKAILNTPHNPALLGDISMETYETPVRNPGKAHSDLFTSFFQGGMPPAQPKWGTPRPKARVHR